MRVWMTWCKRRATCKYCGEYIEVGTPMVKGVIDKSQNPKMMITYKTYFHPQCWVENGLAYLERNPYTPAARGRKRSNLSFVDNQKRRKILARFASYQQSLRKIVGDSPRDKAAKVRINNKVNGLVDEITKLGGVPVSWLGKIETPNIQQDHTTG